MMESQNFEPSESLESEIIKQEDIMVKIELEESTPSRSNDFFLGDQQVLMKNENGEAVTKKEEIEDIFISDWEIKCEEVDNKEEELWEQNETRNTENISSTDTADEATDITLSPPKKRLKKGHLDVSTKEMILSIFKHEMQANPTLILDEIAVRAAYKTGVCRTSVYNVLREYKNCHAFSAPKTNQKRTNSIDSMDEADKSAIRRKIHEFFFRKELPTIDKALKDVNDDQNLPNFKRSTFYKLLKKINLKCQRCGKNSMLIDKDEIVLWRRDYLEKIKSYREENRKIYYLGEKIWVDNTVTSSRQTFLDGLKNSSGKGKKLIMGNVGSDDGFVPDALWVLESKKTGDEEMEGQSFENWFSNMLPRMEDNCVIVLDNAPYHSRKLEKIPSTASQKSEIQDWLRSKNIEFDDSDTLLKVELLAIVNEHKKTYNKYIIDEMAQNQNKIVLRLPPYHCELNPIELIWTDIKNYVGEKSTSLKFADVKNICFEAVTTIAADKWKRYIQHVQHNIEQNLWDLDNIIEVLVGPSVNVGNNSTSSSSEYESE